MTITPKMIGSGQSFSYPVKIGNTARGYKTFAVPQDAETINPAMQPFVDRQSLNGTMWRHTFIATPKTWHIPIIVEDYYPEDHRNWLESIASAGMAETFYLWDTGANGTYTSHTASNGIVYPLTVMFVEIGDMTIRNHDPFKRDCTLVLRKAS